MGSGGGRVLFNSKGGEGEIYWFVDGELRPPADGTDEVWWQMSEGRHKISAADAFGNSAHVWIDVKSGWSKGPEEELPLLEETE